MLFKIHHLLQKPTCSLGLDENIENMFGSVPLHC